jgi:hypothetical protein
MSNAPKRLGFEYSWLHKLFTTWQVLGSAGTKQAVLLDSLSLSGGAVVLFAAGMVGASTRTAQPSMTPT